MKVIQILIFFWCLILIALNTYSQKLSFNTYHVSLYKGKPAPLKLRGNKLAEMYRTTIRDTYYSKKEMVEWHGATGLNFAGHYCFVYWGCGSDCQDAAIVDLKSGVVYQAMTATMRYEFKPYSRLVIVNPGQTKDSCAYCTPEYWVWNDKNKVFKKIR